VLVEGNCDSPVPSSTFVFSSQCGDWDGDGNIGVVEDTDSTDRIFGTLTAALGPGTGGAAGTGANSNGTITIVKSGRFAETLVIPVPIPTPPPNVSPTPTPVPGNVTIEAAPGVAAILDAVLQGDPAGGNTSRQEAVGITIDAPADRLVILRNLIIRNFKVGVRIQGSSRVMIDKCVFENNRDYGIHVLDTARVTILNSRVAGTGRRIPVSGPPTPGNGIDFAVDTKGFVVKTTVMSSVGTGLIAPATVMQNKNTLSFNGTNYTLIP
jgi:parallel beta-helix repeat protein